MKRNLRILTRKYISGFLACSLVAINTMPTLAVEKTKTNEKTTQDEWTMVWNDEFNGAELDKSKWTYDLGNWIVDGNDNGVAAGWGNNELQNYTKDNVDVEDGNLVITAKKEKTSDKHGEYDYTSTRIKTKGLFAKKYGRFEARMALPAEAGLWPAFWMLPEDDKYDGWASSGEIDIMEARGRLPHEVEGTIHYGGKWPNNKYSGKLYEFKEGTDITEFHDYALEWEPGELRWYVDGELYQVKNNWYSESANGDEIYSFPAPFDQEFHLLLNLAVGGWFDGLVEPGEEFKEAEMLVDYVRVYELTGRDYMEPKEPVVEKEEIPEEAKKPVDGNYIYDTNFEQGFGNALSSDRWAFLTNQFGGEATISTEKLNEDNFAKIDVTAGGDQNYSTQLIQYVPIVKGRTYKVSYDAKSNANRKMGVKVSGGEDRGWAVYSGNYSADLTNELKRYEHTFTMPEDTDVNARLEFNLGLDRNDVWIGNVVVEETEPAPIDYDGPKTPLKSGNHVYNGTFDKGLMDRKTYWNLENNSTDKNSKGKYSVDEETRELFINLNGKNGKTSDIALNQKGIKLSKNGEYELTFDARTNAKSGKDIDVVVKGNGGQIIAQEKVKLTKSMDTHTVKFNIPEEKASNQGTLEFLVGGENKNVYLDNVSLVNNAKPDLGDKVIFPLKNGDFSQDLTGWESWSAVGAQFKSEDGKAVINMPNKFWEGGDGAQTWAVQLKQTGLQLYKGLEYVVSFDASSNIEREFEVIAQNSGYYRHFEKKVAVGPETKTYTYSFVPNGDDIVELNFLLGKFGDYEPHEVTIDNVVLEVKNPDNKFENSNFDDNKEPWYMWSETGASDSIVDGVWNIDVPSVGGQFWSVQAIQEGINVEQGKSYRLVFDMKSTIPRDVQVVLDPAKDLMENVKVDEQMKTYTVNYTSGETRTDGKFLFALGNLDGNTQIDPHTVQIDNVYMYEVADLAVEEKPEAPKNITSMEASNGTEIIVGEDGGAGFTFPTFNGGASKFDDVKDDLEVMVKENGEYVNIDSVEKWTYNTNWGHFWDGPGGYWFNPVTETTNVKLVSKLNPYVFIEYTLTVSN